MSPDVGTHQGARGRSGTEPHMLQKGEYAQWQGAWYGRAPNGLIINLSKHEPVLHDDETLSTTKEIYVESGWLSFRGHLEHGIWKEI